MTLTLFPNLWHFSKLFYKASNFLHSHLKILNVPTGLDLCKKIYIYWKENKAGYPNYIIQTNSYSLYHCLCHLFNSQGCLIKNFRYTTAKQIVEREERFKCLQEFWNHVAMDETLKILVFIFLHLIINKLYVRAFWPRYFGLLIINY